MKKIKKLISQIYPSNITEEIYKKIIGLLEKYKGKIKPFSYTLSEKDIILITYPDQLYDDKNTPTLVILKKFLDKYLKGLINTVHILPFFPYSSDDGFSVIDYKQVNPKCGTWKNIKEIASEYNLMIDAVINHISAKSEWFRKYLEGHSKYRNYFIECSPNEKDLSKVVRPRALPLLTKFETCSGDKWLWTTFSEDQIDLNYKNPNVLIDIIDILLFYVQQGARIIRLDAIAYLWKEIGTSCIHLPQTHNIVKLFRAIFEYLNTSIFILTETNVPHKENVSYFGDGDEAHIVYQFSLPPLIAHAILTSTSKYLKKWAQNLETYPNATFLNFTASHDGIGIRPLTGLVPEKDINLLIEITHKNGGYISYKTNSDGTKSVYELNINYFSLLNIEDIELSIKRFLVSQAIMLSMPGIPAIYFHSIIGSQNYKEGVKITGRYRTINREKLEYKKLEEELSNNIVRKTIYSKYTEMLKNRIAFKSFEPYGKYKIIDKGNDTFIIQRIGVEEDMLCIHNITSKQLKINFCEKDLKNYSYLKEVFKDEEYKINSTLEITLEPYQFKWFICSY